MGGAHVDTGEEHELWKQVLVIFLFVGFNIGLNEFNSWALRKDSWPGFHFTWFYTMFHMLVSAIAAYLLQLLVIKPKLGGPTFAQAWDYKLLIIPMGLCSFLMNGLNNASLALMSLFLNQAIKATMPMPTMFFSYLFAKKTYSPLMIFVVFCLCVGSVLSVWYKISTDKGGSQAMGVIMCLIGLLACSIKPVLVMMLTSGLLGDLPKLDTTVVLVYDCCIAFVCMLITWACLDEREQSIAYLADPNTRGIGIIIVICGSLMAFCFNMSNFYFIRFTTALTNTVGGSGVKVFLIVVSAVQIGVADPVSWSGVAIVVASLVTYSYLNLQKPAPKPPAADAEAPKDGTPLIKP
jgi:drug/metabolite transporter (DMT)-like permease